MHAWRRYSKSQKSRSMLADGRISCAEVWQYNESEIDARLSIKVTKYHAVFGKDKLHQNSLYNEYKGLVY